MVRLASVLAVALVSFAALAGCGASQKTTATAAPCDYSAPPGELQMTYETKETATPQRGDVASSYRPNAQERPKQGAVHAAVN